ncbi:hypothetical protein FCM35_KLT18621 [Carex littledalei]|uniref:SAWADEE domain-containing protein n=1 Tax=Carex littledalei TaxID=544730 RepID=A0A833RAQ4_9POAL|nr:hypothetical protein FCM35_KLT18621 [Carex littledalei]
MAIKRKATSQLQRTKGLDFRCPGPDDDAWYGVRLLKVKEGMLRVMYLEFPEEFDKWYLSDQFESLAQIDELLGRFRRPAEQLQDSQCGEVTQDMVVLACDTFRNGEILFYDARVDSVSRSQHNSNGDSEEQVCNCQFRVTWRHGPEIGKHATVRAENICLIQKSPIDDPVLEHFIDNARKSLKERTGNLDSQGRNSGLNPAASSHGASPHPASELELIDVRSSDGSHHHEVDDVIGQTGDSIGTLGEEKDALEDRCSQAEAEVARLKAKIADMEEQARAASAWEKEKSELERKVEHLEEVLFGELYFQKETERYEGLLQEEQARAEAEVARLKAEQAHAASSWEKEKSKLERKVEHLEEVLSEELYFQKEKERYEGLLQELNATVARANAQAQIFKAQMQVAKAEREQAILAFYEIEAKLKGKRYKVGMSASEWKIPEHLTLPPSETVLSTIRNSQAFAPFRRQIEKEIREHLMNQHNPRSSLK